MGIEEKSFVKEKMQLLRKAARGRLSRFQARLQRLAKRRKANPMTITDAVAQATLVQAEYDGELPPGMGVEMARHKVGSG